MDNIILKNSGAAVSMALMLLAGCRGANGAMPFVTSGDRLTDAAAEPYNSRQS